MNILLDHLLFSRFFYFSLFHTWIKLTGTFHIPPLNFGEITHKGKV